MSSMPSSGFPTTKSSLQMRRLFRYANFMFGLYINAPPIHSLSSYKGESSHYFSCFRSHIFSQLWEGCFWKRTTLYDVGASYCLGHKNGMCRQPAKREILTVLHNNGFHKIAMTFCGCATDPDSHSFQIQLLRFGIFPATTENPKTAFTFASLDLLCQLSTQGKMSAYNFYVSMRNLTDNLDLYGWPVSPRINLIKKNTHFLLSLDTIRRTHTSYS